MFRPGQTLPWMYVLCGKALVMVPGGFLAGMDSQLGPFCVAWGGFCALIGGMMLYHCRKWFAWTNRQRWKNPTGLEQEALDHPFQPSYEKSEDFDDWTVTMHDAAKTWKQPEDLFHYTTINGLWGILDKGRLWGTHVAFLNDAQELEYGIEAAITTLQEHGDNLQSSDLDQGSEDPELGNGSLLRGVGDFLERHRDMFKPALAPFVTCLSSSELYITSCAGAGSEYCLKDV